MKSNIKKRFIDILFEPEDYDEEEEIEVEEPVVERKTPVQQTVKEENPLKAKDILYRKSEKSAFIDLDIKKEVKSEKEERKNDYEFSSQISPIFGVLRENDGTSSKKIISPVKEEMINKPDSSHLEIITSPIYGYGRGEDEVKAETPVESYPNNNRDEEELHRLYDSERDYGYDDYSDHTYDDFEQNVLDEDEDEDLNLFNSYREDI